MLFRYKTFFHSHDTDEINASFEIGRNLFSAELQIKHARKLLTTEHKKDCNTEKTTYFKYSHLSVDTIVQLRFCSRKDRQFPLETPIL